MSQDFYMSRARFSDRRYLPFSLFGIDCKMCPFRVIAIEAGE